MTTAISRETRDVLIAHIDTRVSITAGAMCRFRASALGLRLIRQVPHAGHGRPQWTELTDLGRKVLCEALGDWADALDRAQGSGLIPPVPEGEERQVVATETVLQDS